MPVYAIQAGGDCGPVKLGHGDAKNRLIDLQIGNHLTLRIVRIWEGGRAEEEALHTRFEDLWIRGEWYSFSRAIMVGDVGLVEIFGPSVTANFKPLDAETDDGVYHSWAIERCGGVAALSRLLHVDMSTVAKWRTRNIPGRYWHDVVRLAGEGVSIEGLLRTSKPHGHRLQAAA